MRIIKRKKGRKDYFYLQHSFRKEGRVITKEIYLGKKIPENISRIKGEMIIDAKKTLYEKLKKIRDDFQKEWKRYPETIRNKEKEEIAIAFTYNTNAIEGSTITLEETRDIIHYKTSPEKPLRDVKETEAHSGVFLAMLDKKDKVSKKLLLEWHRGIFGETKKDIAGRFRDYLVRVGNYRAPDWQDVKKLMNELINFISKSKDNPVELAARAHYKFEKIHPFGDGNGRIGRLLTNYILWHNKYPMIVIEYKKRRSYYKALERDEEGFVNYFLRRYLSVHKRRVK
ncbi:Fic family protein [Candidatus Woesearchaeota archaeon]|nr:Fic family protein [Candidatus Woesearchaeota archaeon]